VNIGKASQLFYSLQILLASFRVYNYPNTQSVDFWESRTFLSLAKSDKSSYSCLFILVEYIKTSSCLLLLLSLNFFCSVLPLCTNLLVLIGSFSFFSFSNIKNTAGKNTDGITFKFTLKENLPEWLPIQGKRMRIYHHGIKRQCNGCFGIGHAKWQCKAAKINWRGYVDQLVTSGRFKKEMFGSWIKTDTPKVPETDDEDLRALIGNPEKLQKMLNLFKTMKEQSQPGPSQPKGRGRPKGVPGNQKNQGKQGGQNGKGRQNGEGKNPPAKKKKAE